MRISRLEAPGRKRSIAEDVRTGLTSEPKDLLPWPKYFYDAEGSELFEEITSQPEYYQTRTKLSILEARARESWLRPAAGDW